MAIATAASALPRRMLALPPSFPDELNALHRLLAFPEEVALKLTETEYELFNCVPSIDYLRHCTTDLTSRPHLQQPKAQEDGVLSLIRRFNEVSFTFELSLSRHSVNAVSRGKDVPFSAWLSPVPSKSVLLLHYIKM